MDSDSLYPTFQEPVFETVDDLVDPADIGEDAGPPVNPDNDEIG